MERQSFPERNAWGILNGTQKCSRSTVCAAPTMALSLSHSVAVHGILQPNWTAPKRIAVAQQCTRTRTAHNVRPTTNNPRARQQSTIASNVTVQWFSCRRNETTWMLAWFIQRQKSIREFPIRFCFLVRTVRRINQKWQFSLAVHFSNLNIRIGFLIGCWCRFFGRNWHFTKCRMNWAKWCASDFEAPAVSPRWESEGNVWMKYRLFFRQI